MRSLTDAIKNRLRNVLLETRAKEHFSTGGSNDKMRLSFFLTEPKNTKSETFLDRILAFNSPVENVPWLAFLISGTGYFYSARKGPHPDALRD